MTDTDIITPEIVETVDYAVRQTQLLEVIAIDVHALVLIGVAFGGFLIACLILYVIKKCISLWDIF